MKTSMRFLWIATFAICVFTFDHADAQTRFGLRGGFYMEQDKAFLGAHLLSAVQRNWMLSPNFEYVLIDEGSLFTINTDLHYDFPSRSHTIFWLGAGLGISHFSLETFDNTDVGLNLLSGVSFGRGPMIPFLQVKIATFDNTQLVLGGGITF